MSSRTYFNQSVWSVPFVAYQKAKPKGCGPMLEEARVDHAIRSAIAIMKLPLVRDILTMKKKMNSKSRNVIL